MGPGSWYSPQCLAWCELLCDIEGGGGGGGTLDTRRVAEATLQVLKEKRIWREIAHSGSERENIFEGVSFWGSKENNMDGGNLISVSERQRRKFNLWWRMTVGISEAPVHVRFGLREQYYWMTIAILASWLQFTWVALTRTCCKKCHLHYFPARAVTIMAFTLRATITITLTTTTTITLTTIITITLTRRGLDNRMPALRPQLLPSPVFWPI